MQQKACDATLSTELLSDFAATDIMERERKGGAGEALTRAQGFVEERGAVLEYWLSTVISGNLVPC